MITTGLSTSLDGFIAGADDGPDQPFGVGGDRLFNWLGDGDTPSRYYPSFKMSAQARASSTSSPAGTSRSLQAAAPMT
jgi:hypothetical protein